MLALSLNTFVTYNPRSVSAQMTIERAASLMEDLQIHHLPVVDGERGIVGIVSHRDLCGAYRGRLTTGGAPEQTVEQVMVRSVFTVDHLATPSSALQALLDHSFHSVPVVQDGQLVGMITSTDFLRELSYGELPASEHRVGEHMVQLSDDELLFSAATETDALVEESSVVSSDQTLAVAAGLMLEFDVREIAVVDGLGRPIGVLRDDDILRALASALA